MKEIKLACGLVAMIDDEDFPMVSSRSWFRRIDGNKVYAVSIISKRKVFLHRFLLGDRPGTVIDHINGNGLDNRRENLRICSVSENSMNRGMDRRNPHGYKGLSIRCGKWQARIGAHGKTHYLGLFETKEAAHQAYCEAGRRLHGEFFNDGKAVPHE